MPTSPPPASSRPARSAHRRARACLAAARTLIVLALAAPARAAADDTEVFFADGPAPGASSTNILLVLPASRAMGCPIGTVARCETAVHDGSSRMDVLKSALARLVEAHHFVVESMGASGAGARAELVQGFYLVGPADD